MGKGGRPAEYCRRDIVDAIRYLVKEGIQWRATPACRQLAGRDGVVAPAIPVR